MYENKRLGFLFVLPFVLGVLLFKLFPFVMSFALSFTQYDLIDPPVWAVAMTSLPARISGIAARWMSVGCS